MTVFHVFQFTVCTDTAYFVHGLSGINVLFVIHSTHMHGCYQKCNTAGTVDDTFCLNTVNLMARVAAARHSITWRLITMHGTSVAGKVNHSLSSYLGKTLTCSAPRVVLILELLTCTAAQHLVQDWCTLPHTPTTACHVSVHWKYFIPNSRFSKFPKSASFPLLVFHIICS